MKNGLNLALVLCFLGTRRINMMFNIALTEITQHYYAAEINFKICKYD